MWHFKKESKLCTGGPGSVMHGGAGCYTLPGPRAKALIHLEIPLTELTFATRMTGEGSLQVVVNCV